MITYEQIKNAIEDPTFTTRGIDIYNSYGHKMQISGNDILKKKGKIFYAKNLDKVLHNVFSKGNFDFLKLIFYKSNGTTWKDGRELIIYKEDLTQHPATTTQPMQHNEQPMQHNSQPATNDFSNLLNMLNMGGMNAPGMNAPELIYRYKDYPEVKKERDIYKDKLEKCKEDCKKIEKEKEKLELDLKLRDIKADSKSFWESPFFETLKDLAPGIVEKAMIQSQQIDGNAGMNAPAAINSPVKQQFCAVIQDLDETHVAYLNNIINLLMNNPQFSQELSMLVKKYS